jgi:XTP/dITP diphosphohydrolase
MKAWPYPYLVIATANENKKKQFADLFREELGIEVKGLNDFQDVPAIIEDQETFEGNAIKKAEIIRDWLNMPVISDDSGLVVPALGGKPGVHSARYAGKGATDQQNNEKLIQEIQIVPEDRRQAYYVCVMALAIPGEETRTVRGECHGVILDTPRGTEGFGYDPLFYLPEYEKTMAELDKKVRYQISHRAKATRRMIELLKERFTFST